MLLPTELLAGLGVACFSSAGIMLHPPPTPTLDRRPVRCRAARRFASHRFLRRSRGREGKGSGVAGARGAEDARRPLSCELHLNGRLSRAARAGVRASGAGRCGGRRSEGAGWHGAVASCNLLRLLPRLAPGSAAKRVGEGGADGGALRQFGTAGTRVGDGGSLNCTPPHPSGNSDPMGSGCSRPSAS